jgi:hypothetical protein
VNATRDAARHPLLGERGPIVFNLAVLAMAMAMPAEAAEVLLLNAGVSASGAKLPISAPDPHWQVVSGPGVAAPAPAVVVNVQHPFGNYFETTDSMWVWANAVGGGGGPYTFRLQFDLTGLDPRAVTFSGSWGIDNTGGTIALNGAAPTGTGLSLIPTSPNNYNQLHAFSITGGFVSGINSLDFTVTDVRNPGALNVTGLSSIPAITAIRNHQISLFLAAASLSYAVSEGMVALKVETPNRR